MYRHALWVCCTRIHRWYNISNCHLLDLTERKKLPTSIILMWILNIIFPSIWLISAVVIMLYTAPELNSNENSWFYLDCFLHWKTTVYDNAVAPLVGDGSRGIRYRQGDILCYCPGQISCWASYHRQQAWRNGHRRDGSHWPRLHHQGKGQSRQKVKDQSR